MKHWILDIHRKMQMQIVFCPELSFYLLATCELDIFILFILI